MERGQLGQDVDHELEPERRKLEIQEEGEEDQH